MTGSFGTFCHISQYGEWGYRSLGRMLAVSDPLNLWAPSSVMLAAPTCGIPPRDFLDMVDSGAIRVFGRYEWLSDPRTRDTDRWPGTAWDPAIDGEIWRICQADMGKPEEERRVVVAPPEEGERWAEEYLDTYPGQDSRWVRLLRSRQADSRVPAETLDAARRLLEQNSEREAARRVLRDAHNHGVAFAGSGAAAPFLLESIDARFLALLATAPNACPLPPGRTVPDDARHDLDAGLVAVQLVELLRQLDRHVGAAQDANALKKFVGSAGHQELVVWMRRVCGLLESAHPRTVDDIVATALRDELLAAKITSLGAELLRRKDEVAVGLVALVTTVVGFAADPTGVTAGLGLAAGAYPVGKGLAREIGLVPATFSGPQWPFLYTYGTRAKRRQIAKLRFLLEDLGASR